MGVEEIDSRFSFINVNYPHVSHHEWEFTRISTQERFLSIQTYIPYFFSYELVTGFGEETSEIWTIFRFQIAKEPEQDSKLN